VQPPFRSASARRVLPPVKAPPIVSDAAHRCQGRQPNKGDTAANALKDPTTTRSRATSPTPVITELRDLLGLGAEALHDLEEILEPLPHLRSPAVDLSKSRKLGVLLPYNIWAKESHEGSKVASVEGANSSGRQATVAHRSLCGREPHGKPACRDPSRRATTRTHDLYKIEVVAHDARAIR
jgi:hypothetical protein